MGGDPNPLTSTGMILQVPSNSHLTHHQPTAAGIENTVGPPNCFHLIDKVLHAGNCGNCSLLECCKYTESMEYVCGIHCIYKSFIFFYGGLNPSEMDHFPK